MRCTDCGEDPVVKPAYGRMVRKLPDGRREGLCQRCSSGRGKKASLAKRTAKR